jgi:hypothetical protein
MAFVWSVECLMGKVLLYWRDTSLMKKFTGLILFLGVHSTRMLADDLRSRSIARMGAKPWKGL